MTSINRFDDIVSDIIGEFFNIILGHALSKWDMGEFNIKFGPPKLSFNFVSDKKGLPETERYFIKFFFASDSVVLDLDDLMLMVTFSPYLKSELSGKTHFGS